MSLTDAQITGAPTPLMLGEDEFSALPLTDIMFSELDEWIRGWYIKTARASAPKGMSSAEVEERREITEAAINVCSGVTFLNDKGQAIVGTREGISKITELMIRENHPKVTREMLLKYFNDQTNIENVRIVFQHLHQFLFQSSEKEPSGKGESGE